MRKPRKRQIIKAHFKNAPRVHITISKEELNQAFQSPEDLEELIERKYEEARDIIYGPYADAISAWVLDAYTKSYGGEGYNGGGEIFEKITKH